MKTCNTCRHFNDGECRESPPQVFCFVVPGKLAGQIAVNVDAQYPRVNVDKPCGKHREIEN